MFTPIKTLNVYGVILKKTKPNILPLFYITLRIPTIMQDQNYQIEYLSDKCEEILFLDSSAGIIIAGDINQLPITDFSMQHNLQQLVSKYTRGQRILDIFITTVTVRIYGNNLQSLKGW